MAVFSSDQVNHVFVKGVDSSDVQYGIDGAALAGTAPTAAAIGKSVTFSATAKDKKGNEADVRMLISLARVQARKKDMNRARVTIRKVRSRISELSEFEKREFEDVAKSVK